MLKPEQAHNLAKLAKYLLSLPEDYDKFHMGYYNTDDRLPSPEKELSCGSVACAIGHGPAAGIGVTNFVTYSEVNWYRYALEVFTNDLILSSWMFDMWWKDIDNTVEGAARRIVVVLEQGESPMLCEIADNIVCSKYYLEPKYRELIQGVDLSILDRPEDWEIYSRWRSK